MPRSRATRSEVAWSSTAVFGVTRTAVRPVSTVSVTICAAATFWSADAIATTRSAYAAGTVTNSGAAAPGPKDPVTMS